MIRVIYLSKETAVLSADALLTLVTQCHRNNPSRGLTGMLLYGNGTFLQALEGEDEVVDHLIELIRRDPRHTNMTVVRREHIAVRQYADWSMGFEQVTDRTLQEIPGLRNFGLRNFTPEYLSGHGDVIESLLERHRAPHWDPLVREIDARDKLISDIRRELSVARNANEMAALVIETVLDAAQENRLEATHLDICRSALRSLR